jgi:hypothetical protein
LWLSEAPVDHLLKELPLPVTGNSKIFFVLAHQFYLQKLNYLLPKIESEVTKPAIKIIAMILRINAKG